NRWWNLAVVLALAFTAPAAAQTFSMPALPAPDLATARQVLQAVCGPHAGNGQTGTTGGPSCPGYCPPGTALAGQGGQELALTTVTRGAFVKPGETDLLASYSGCEPSSRNSGGLYVLRPAGSGWTATRAAGLELDNCLKQRRPDGRDQLLCWLAPATGSSLSLDTVAFNPTPVVKPLFTVSSNLAGCKPPYHAQEPESLAWRDVNGDHRPDLIAQIAATTLKTTTQACNGGAITMPQPKTYTLTFLFNGTDYKPDAPTARLIKSLGL
ncbi:MAG TPA: hypothetical protein VHN99_03915, partial [Deinococcales bacterium]|nr:hypothetical protein [Deinococcales bacterium]